MANLTPLWMQNGSYPARYDRLGLKELFGGRELILRGIVVSQTGAGALSVDITAGAATILGDDQTDQGMYLAVKDATETLPMPAAPGSNKRIDLISLRINDPQAGGPVGNNFTFVVTQGSVSATPVAPTLPTSAIPVAQVLRTAGDAAVLAAQLTDVGARGQWPYTISAIQPPATMPVNSLWVVVT